MSEAKHTPGPWAVFPDSVSEAPEDHVAVVIWPNRGSDEDAVCEVYGELTGPDYERPLAEQMANARLIAAAPDLLEAARQAFHLMNTSGQPEERPVSDVMAALAAAICKATGE